MKSIKIPKEVMEVCYEAAAADALSREYDRWLLPTPKVLYYRAKAVKANALARRLLRTLNPAAAKGEWVLDLVDGTATRVDFEAPAPKKPRAPRKPKAVVAAQEGEKA